MFHFKILSLSLSLLILSTTNAFLSSKPNIVFFLTDDQDQMLGGSFPTTGEATPVRKKRRKRKKTYRTRKYDLSVIKDEENINQVQKYQFYDEIHLKHKHAITQ